MVYSKVIIDDRKQTKNNIYSIVVRITYNRKNTSIATGVKLEKLHWLKDSCLIGSSHPNYQHLNQSISETYLRIQKICLQLESEGEFSFELLKDRFNSKSKPIQLVKNGCFDDFAQQLIRDTFTAIMQVVKN